MKKVFCILSWCYVVFAVLMCFGTGSLAASIVLIGSAIVALPIKLMRNVWEKVAKKHVVWVKPVVIFVIFCVAVCITPDTQVDNDNEISNSDIGINISEIEETEPVTETPKAEKTEPETEAPKAEETEPETEAPKAEETEHITESPKAEETEPETEAPKVEETEPETEAPKPEETEPITEAPKAEETEPVTEAPETETSVKEETRKGITYTLNTSSKKFHYPSCYSAKKINADNKSTYTGERADLIARGYSPCGNCDP